MDVTREVAIYGVDAIVRRSAPLQATATARGRDRGCGMIDTIVALWLAQPEWLRTSLISTRPDPRRHDHGDPVRGLHDAGRAQGHRLHAGAHRPEPGRAARPAAAVRRRHQAADEGSHRPVALEPLPVRRGAAADAHAGLRGLGGDVRCGRASRSRDIDAGVLYILALAGFGVYGIILAGWAANSKYAFLGAMRSAAQIVAYEIAMGFALVGVVMAAGTLNIGKIVEAQAGGPGSGTGLAVPAVVVYFISAWPRPTARRSTSPKASRKSSPASTSSTRASPSRCSSWPNTPT